MEAVIEQGTLFPLVEEKARGRGFLREWKDAIERHGPLVLKSQVALILDVSRQRVSQLEKQGRIVSVKVWNREWVPVASIETYFADERKNGRPPAHPLLDEVSWLRRLTDQQKKLVKKTA